MRLVYDWSRILRKAWSVRLMIIAGLFSGAEVILPLFMADIPRNLFAVLSMLTVMGAMVARLVAQKGMHDD